MSTQLSKILKLQNSVLAKYLLRNILLLFLAVFFILGLVVFGNQLVLVIKESFQQNIPVADLLPIVGFKMLRDVSLIVSLSLFLAIILAIGNLYKNSEAVVMNSLGVGDKHFMLFIQPVVILSVIFVLFLTTVVVPWSKHQRLLIMDRVENASEFSFIRQGEFQEFKGGDIVFYASKVNNAEGESQQDMEEIFVYTYAGGEPVITLAKQAQKYSDASTGSVYLRLKEGRRYHGFPSDQEKKILKFGEYDLKIIDGQASTEQAQAAIKTEAKPTLDLLFSDRAVENAELQWRLSQALSVFILAFLGVLLGKASPRGGKNLGVLFGVVIFIIYNNALLIAKTSVESGEVHPAIGLWWVHLLMLVFIGLFYAHRHAKFALLLSRS